MDGGPPRLPPFKYLIFGGVWGEKNFFFLLIEFFILVTLSQKKPKDFPPQVFFIGKKPWGFSGKFFFEIFFFPPHFFFIL